MQSMRKRGAPATPHIARKSSSGSTLTATLTATLERSRSQMSADDKDGGRSSSNAVHAHHASPEDVRLEQLPMHGQLLSLQATPMVGELADTSTVPLLPGEQIATTSHLHDKWTKHNLTATGNAPSSDVAALGLSLIHI